MGNKQSGVSLSGSQQHVAEPTSRSFSWQPDPLFAGEPVKRGESFTGSGARPGQSMASNAGSATMQRAVPYASSEFGSPGVYRHRQASSPSLAGGSGNGSVVRGDAAFGGVQKELLKPALKSNSAKPGNSVNTADSGYMTEIAAQDSDNSARGRLRGSRLSLNDAMLGGTEFVQQQPPPMMHPMPMGHHFMHMHPPPGMIPYGPPPGFGPPPDPFLFPPMLNSRGAPMDEKKAKKLRKKQQKNQQQQLNRHSSMLGDMPGPGEFMPPPGAYALVPAPMVSYGPPPPHQLANFRSRSIDNFMAAGLVQQAPIMAPPPPQFHHAQQQGLAVRRYNSHIDISGVGLGPGYQSATLGPGMGTGNGPLGPMPTEYREKTPPVKKERKYEKRKDQQPGSLRDSSLGSNRGHLTEAGFTNAKIPNAPKHRTETSASIENRILEDAKADPNESAFGQNQGNQLVQGSHTIQLASENAKSQSSNRRSEVIYETLKGAQRAIMATSAEINTLTVNVSEKKESEKLEKLNGINENGAQDSPPPPTPKPVVITPEAKTILERNARILVEAELEEQQSQPMEIQVNKEVIQANEQRKTEQSQAPVISKMVEELRKIPTPPPPPPMPPVQGHRVQHDAPKTILAAKSSVQEEILKPELAPAPQPVPAAEAHAPIRKNEKPVQKEASHEEQSKMGNSSEKHSLTSDPDDMESMIEATLNPILPRRKYKRPKEFEPLDAWRGINVQQELIKRQPQRNAIEANQQQPVVEERIQVRLVPSPPSRREQHGAEPIYLEYDERLPEFKKRLIETGSFDIPEVEKFHHRSNSQPSAGSRGRQDMSPTRWELSADRLTNGAPDQHQRQSQPQLWRDYVAMEEAAASATVGNGSIRSRKTVDSNKGSLRRLKESVANIFRTKSNDQLRPPNGQPISTATDDIAPLFSPPTGGRYAPSLTPSTSKIKAGDSSDIDFSWVHDLETRFRLEREQFERELQTLKQKSATLQKNDYMLSPKLHRQHSYQPKMNSEIEPAREERFSPSLRGAPLSPSLRGPPPPQTNGQQNYNNNHYRDKSFSSSVDLAATSARGGQTPPPPGRMSVYHSQQTLNDRPPSRLMMDQREKSRYFGVYDSPQSAGVANQQVEIVSRDPYERSFRNELQHMVPINVRQKAALFENETQRVQREMDERNQHLARQKQQRSSSAPHRTYVQQQPSYRSNLQPQRSLEADEPIYIPRPDYDETMNGQHPRGNIQHHRQNSAGRVNGHHLEPSNGVDYPIQSSANLGGRYKDLGNDDRLFAPPYMNEPLIVNTTNAGPAPRTNYISSPRSPSERKLARFYNSHANFASPNANGHRSNGVVVGRYESQPVLGSANAGGQRYGHYSPSQRSPRLARAQQQQYPDANRNNANWGRNVNGFDAGVQQQQMIKGNRIGQRPAGNGARGVAFANE